MMKHSGILMAGGRPICFAVPSEWLNYHYTQISPLKASSALFRAQIMDVYVLEAYIVLRIKNMILGRRGKDWLIMIHAEQNDKGETFNTYWIANVLTDRLKAHPFNYIESTRHVGG